MGWRKKKNYYFWIFWIDITKNNYGGKMATPEQRYNFWEQFFNKANIKSDIFAGAKTKKGQPRYIEIRIGVKGLNFAVVVLQNKSWVELCIQLSREEGSAIFNDFQSKSSEIDKKFGETIVWFPNSEHTQRCRIASHEIPNGILDENKWDELQDDLIDKMIRLYATLKGYGYY